MAPGSAQAKDGLEWLRNGTKSYAANRGAAFEADKEITSVKSSNKKAVTAKVTKLEDKWQLELNFKKPGKAKVTYKSEGKSRTIKIRVYKYSNPVKSLKVGKDEFGSKFKKTEFIFTKKLLSGKLNIKPSKGWKVKEVYVYGDVGKYSMKKVSAKYKVPAKKVCAVGVHLYNKSKKIDEWVDINSTNKNMNAKAKEWAGIA